MIEKLFERKADLTKKNKQGKTALEIATDAATQDASYIDVRNKLRELSQK